MQDIYCLLVFPFFLPTFMIASGLVYIFKKDWAWRIAEWGLRYVKPQRTPEWEHLATINGVIMLVFGVMIILFLLSRLL